MSLMAPASDPGPLDFGHLERMTCGEKALEREVLVMFLNQTGRIIDALAGRPAEAATLAHTLKGSARAIGAFHVAERAAVLEQAARNSDEPTDALAELCVAVAEARRAIEVRLGQPDPVQ
jgi:HPt (histidine-containing phosphotransfer) domain-containing protein